MQSVLGLGWGSPPAPSVGERDDAGDGPGEGRHFARDGHHEVIGCLPRAVSCRYRLHRRSCAFQPMACTSAGSFSGRSWRWRLNFAG